ELNKGPCRQKHDECTFQNTIKIRKSRSFLACFVWLDNFFTARLLILQFNLARQDLKSSLRFFHSYLHQCLTTNVRRRSFYAVVFPVGHSIKKIKTTYTVLLVYSKKYQTIANHRNGWRPKRKWWEKTDISLQANDAMFDKQKSFHKGHLLPVGIYSFSEEHAKSTFTYTNAVPQYSTFNSGIWSNYEGYIRTYAKNKCGPNSGGDLYLITGVTMLARVGDHKVEKIVKTSDYLKNKIRIPRSMWTVGCCVAAGGEVLGNFAVIGNNLKSKIRVQMTELKVKKLEAIILEDVQASPSGSSATSIQLFPGKAQCSDNGKQIVFKAEQTRTFRRVRDATYQRKQPSKKMTRI
ncbi:endonuclease domain-containing 1 -like, partial [Paramuricea clavata]